MTRTAASRWTASTTACRNCRTRLRTQWDTLGFNAEAFLGAIGLSVPAGEKGRSALEMVWSRPTCEINGMGGGYQGEGFKTVIPAVASAKVSFRLVFDQDPHKVRAAFREHVQARLPADCRAEFNEHGSGQAIRFPDDDPAFAKARQALSDEWGKPAVFIGGGGSIPVTLAAEAVARDGRGAGRLRARRRPHPQPEREVQPGQLPQGHPLLGAHPRRAGAQAGERRSQRGGQRQWRCDTDHVTAP